MSWMRECLPERVRILVGFGEGVRTVILRSCLLVVVVVVVFLDAGLSREGTFVVSLVFD